MISLLLKTKGYARVSSTSFASRALLLTAFKQTQTRNFSKSTLCMSNKPSLFNQRINSQTRTFANLTPQTILTSPSSSLTSTNKLPTPLGYENTPILRLQTLTLPTTPIISPTPENRALASHLISGLRTNNILQFALTPHQESLYNECLAVSKSFFSLPYSQKKDLVDERSFAGYIASGEEITDGKADYSEIFTVVKDLPLSDYRVQGDWPCHGPCPWPSPLFAQKMEELMASLAETGEVVLQLLALGMGLPTYFFKTLTEDGWHHMRVLHFKPLDGEKDDEGNLKRGIGAHTDYGLLVLALSEPIHSVFFQMRDGEWKLLQQREGTMTCFPGDMLQLLTNDLLMSTPHKVALNTTDRFAFAYFQEPNFNAVVEPHPELKDIEVAPAVGGVKEKGKVHYGSHFTEKFMNNYSERITAKRIREIGSLEILKKLREEAFAK